MSKLVPMNRYAAFALIIASMVLVSQCSKDDNGFVPKVEGEEPTAITIVSGDSQYSLHGTPVPDPLVVSVTTADGAAIRGTAVNFQVTQGGGTISASSMLTDPNG